MNLLKKVGLFAARAGLVVLAIAMIAALWCLEIILMLGPDKEKRIERRKD